ncbi:MAG: DUF4340 domain-containing protein [Deltaproteobacteria bacterium]|nr:DUF4340 domain-containing protein [Deltaproteobacteria bacterium]
MSLVRTLVVLVVFLALGAFYYFYEVKGGKAREEAEDKAKKVFDVKEEEIAEILLRKGAREIRLQKKDGAWRLVQPLETPADADAMRQLLVTLTGAQKEREVEPKPASLEPYALQKPEMTVSLRTKGAPIQLALGGKNPTGAFLYAKREDRPPVFLLPESFGKDLDKGVFDLRDKTVLPIGTREAKVVEYQHGQEAVRLERGGGEEWKLVRPFPYKADVDKVRQLVERFRDAKIKEFVEEQATRLARYGLDRPVAQLAVADDPKKQPYRLLVGKAEPAKKALYAKHAASPQVFLIEEDVLKNLPQSARDFRDTSFWTVNRDSVEKLEVTYASAQIFLERTRKTEWDEDWFFRKPVQARADSPSVRSFLRELDELRAVDVVGKTPGDYGVDRPAVRVQFWEQGKKEPRAILLGRAAPGGKGLYARIEPEGTVLVLKDDVKGTLSKTVTELRDKHVLAFKLDDVQKMRVKAKLGLFLWEKKGDKWRVLEGPKGRELDPRAVRPVLWDVQDLVYKEIVKEEDPSPKPYGFDQPRAEVTLWGKDGKEIGTIQIGGAVPGKPLLHARTSVAKAVYGVGAEFEGTLEKKLQEAFKEE